MAVTLKHNVAQTRRAPLPLSRYMPFVPTLTVK
jgi:hypothetical protein